MNGKLSCVNLLKVFEYGKDRFLNAEDAESVHQTGVFFAVAFKGNVGRAESLVLFFRVHGCKFSSYTIETPKSVFIEDCWNCFGVIYL